METKDNFSTEQEAKELFKAAHIQKQQMNYYEYVRLSAKAIKRGAKVALLDMGKPEDCKSELSIFLDIK